MIEPTEPVLAVEFISDVIEHMNTDHAESLSHYAVVFGSIDWADSVLMTKLTAGGLELECQSGSSRQECVWIDFEQPIKRPEQVRGVLVAMAKKARGAIEGKR